MRTAREVIAEAIGENEGLRLGDYKNVWANLDDDDQRWFLVSADLTVADLRAEGLVIVAAADVRAVLNQAYVGWESDAVRSRLDAALAEGGIDGESVAG